MTRIHPDDPNVVEVSVDFVTSKGIEACDGCPHRHEEGCPEAEDQLRHCSENKVWYGQHIVVANKLEGK